MAGANVFWVAEYTRCRVKSSYHKHEFYQMVSPLSGEILVNGEFTVRPGDIMLTKPEQCHSFPATPQYHNKEISLFDCKFTVTDLELHAALIHTPHIFKKIFGMTPIHYVILRQIEKAKELLLYTDMTISEISEMSGSAAFIISARPLRSGKVFPP